MEKDLIEGEVFRRYQKTKDVDLRNNIINAYSPFVKNVARKTYVGLIVKRLPNNINLKKFDTFFNYGDCEQAGYKGLMDSIDKYSPDNKKGFKAFSYKRIQGEILDQFIKFVYPINRIGFKGMKQREEVIAKKFSLEHPIWEDNKRIELKDLLKQEIDNSLEKIEILDSVIFLLKGFSDKDKRTIIYCELGGYTLEQAAKKLGVSNNLVWQNHRGIIERLKQKVQKRPIYSDFI